MYCWFICKTQIDVQFLNPSSDTCTSDLCPFFKFSNQHSILKSMSFFKFPNQRPILYGRFSLSHPMKSLMYSLTLINKSAIDFRIWKRCRFENPLYRTVIWDNDVSGDRFEKWMPIWVRMLIWVYHIYVLFI